MSLSQRLSDLFTGSRGTVALRELGIKGPRPWIDVSAYDGVDPTGATDSTAALQSILSGVTSGDLVIFPRGTYLTTGGLYAPNPCTILGPGTLKISGNGNYDWVLNTRGAVSRVVGLRLDQSAFSAHAGRGEGLRVEGVDTVVRDCYAIGEGEGSASTVSDCFYLRSGADRSIIQGCQAVDAGYAGFRIQTANGCRISQCSSKNHAQKGVAVNGGVPSGSTTCSTTLGSPTLSSVGNTALWHVGQAIYGHGTVYGEPIPVGSFVIAVGASTLTISQNCSTSTSGTSIYEPQSCIIQGIHLELSSMRLATGEGNGILVDAGDGDIWGRAVISDITAIGPHVAGVIKGDCALEMTVSNVQGHVWSNDYTQGTFIVFATNFDRVSKLLASDLCFTGAPLRFTNEGSTGNGFVNGILKNIQVDITGTGLPHCIDLKGHEVTIRGMSLIGAATGGIRLGENDSYQRFVIDDLTFTGTSSSIPLIFLGSGVEMRPERLALGRARIITGAGTFTGSTTDDQKINRSVGGEARRFEVTTLPYLVTPPARSTYERGDEIVFRTPPASSMRGVVCSSRGTCHLLTTVNTNSGSAVVAVTDAAMVANGNWAIGDVVKAGAFLAADTTVLSISGSNITLNANANATLSGTPMYDAQFVSLANTGAAQN